MKVQEDGVQVYGDKSMKSKEELGVNIEDKGPMDDDQEIILNPDFPKPMKMMWDQTLLLDESRDECVSISYLISS